MATLQLGFVIVVLLAIMWILAGIRSIAKELLIVLRDIDRSLRNRDLRR